MNNVSFRLEGKVALVTGASRGIGKALAEGLGMAGADVILVARSKNEIEQGAQKIADLTGRRTLALTCDVTDGDSINVMLKKAISEFGHIDILVNNAGTAHKHSAIDVTEEEWDRVFDLNLKSVFFVSQAVGKHMIERGYGRIINMASVASVLTNTNMTAYGPSKAGLAHLTKQLANEWAKNNITVNAISPAFVKTDLTKGIFGNKEVSRRVLNKTPLGRFAELRDLIAPVVFFASEGASYVTGQNLLIDGGRSIYSN